MNDLQREYLEERIKKILYEMSSTFFDIQLREEAKNYSQDEPDVDFEMHTSMLEDNFTDSAKSVIKLITLYIEKYGGVGYLNDFKEKVIPYYESNQKLLTGHFHQESGDVYSELLSEFWQFLFGFESFGNNDYEELLKRTGITYLENILENTSVILTEQSKTPQSESDVYNGVKVVIKGVFPSANYPTTSFVTTAQEYKPDILLPFLNCAVEYKYAMTEQKLKSTIDQIFADVHGYSNNKVYKLFYAVFYVKSGIWGRKKFDEVWKEKGFPKNWKGIFVEA